MHCKRQGTPTGMVPVLFNKAQEHPPKSLNATHHTRLRGNMSKPFPPYPPFGSAPALLGSLGIRVWLVNVARSVLFAIFYIFFFKDECWLIHQLINQCCRLWLLFWISKSVLEIRFLPACFYHYPVACYLVCLWCSIPIAFPENYRHRIDRAHKHICYTVSTRLSFIGSMHDLTETSRTVSSMHHLVHSFTSSPIGEAIWHVSCSLKRSCNCVNACNTRFFSYAFIVVHIPLWCWKLISKQL